MCLLLVGVWVSIKFRKLPRVATKAIANHVSKTFFRNSTHRNKKNAKVTSVGTAAKRKRLIQQAIVDLVVMQGPVTCAAR